MKVTSSDDDDMGNGDAVVSDDRTVAISKSTTGIHTFVLTVHNICRYVNGNLEETKIMMDKDYYQFSDQ